MKTIAIILINAAVASIILLMIYQFIKNKMWRDLFILAAAMITLTACTKPLADLPKPIQPIKVDTIQVHHDTIPDGSYLRLKLMSVTDTLQSDDVLINFDHTAHAIYVPGEDAPSFQGFGQESLTVFSSDGQRLAIDWTPSVPSIKIGVTSKNGGDYILKQSGTVKHVWLYDAKDSVAMPYKFTLKAGLDSSRFKVELR